MPQELKVQLSSYIQVNSPVWCRSATNGAERRVQTSGVLVQRYSDGGERNFVPNPTGLADDMRYYVYPAFDQVLRIDWFVRYRPDMSKYFVHKNH